jgi:acyl-CoA thioester hydrolase
VTKKIVFREPIHTFQIDFNRHVSNIVYIQWMEIGRLKLLREIGLPVEQIDVAGFLPVLIETHITYKRPLLLGDAVEVELWLSEISGVHAWMEFRFVKVGGGLAAQGRQKGIFVDVKSGRPKRLTDAERDLFLAYLEEGNKVDHLSSS